VALLTLHLEVGENLELLNDYGILVVLIKKKQNAAVTLVAASVVL